MSLSSDLKVSLVQTPLHWENPEENYRHLSDLIRPLAGKTDLVVLPEMFTTGFSMDSARLAEPLNGPTLGWMVQTAQDLDAVVTGSIIVEEGGNYFNRLIWMQPDGHFQTYDKRHLFRMAEEDAHFEGGTAQLVVEWRGWRICPLICYDLRFPVWSRNRYENGAAAYDVLIYVANWPAARRTAWQTLLRARAHENQVYVLGVNRVGEDGKGIAYAGDSAVISPKGADLMEFETNETGVKTAVLSAEALNDFRVKFPVGLDADDFTLG